MVAQVVPNSLHTVGSKVWLRDLEEGWVRGEVLCLGENDKLIVRMEDGTEHSFDESEIPLQNPGERGVEVRCFTCPFRW